MHPSCQPIVVCREAFFVDCDLQACQTAATPARLLSLLAQVVARSSCRSTALKYIEVHQHWTHHEPEWLQRALALSPVPACSMYCHSMVLERLQMKHRATYAMWLCMASWIHSQAADTTLKY